jgi:hypothetical protein
MFSVVLAATVAMQRRDKHTLTTIEGLCFLLGPCGGVNLKTIGATGRLESETLKYGRESQGTQTREKDCAGKGQQHRKKTDPSSRQRGRPTDRNCHTVINIWSWAPDGARHQDSLTD